MVRVADANIWAREHRVDPGEFPAADFGLVPVAEGWFVPADGDGSEGGWLMVFVALGLDGRCRGDDIILMADGL